MSADSYQKASLWQELPKACRQVLWVEVAKATDREATLHLLHRTTRDAESWQAVRPAWRVKIGRKGVAGGLGKHRVRGASIPMKQEGDAKTPLGIFELPFVYGVRSPQEAKAWVRLPYQQMTEHHAGVDDSLSKYYNQVVDRREVSEDWDSAEKMVLKDGTYDWGIYVSHNPEGQAQAGSCIFIHLKKANGDSTSGCVAMSRDEMEAVIRDLDPKLKPLLLVSLESLVE